MWPLLLLLLVNGIHAELEYDSYRVWKATESNLAALTNKHYQLYLFMHRPGCQHSEEYKQRYAELAYNLQQVGKQVATGIVDCEVQYQLCERLSVTNYPTLLRMEGGKHSVVDEIEFLYQLEQHPPNRDEKHLTNQMVKWLEQSPHYFVAVLEEEGFEVPDEELVGGDRVAYLQPGQLYFTLLNLSNHRTGCWIYESMQDQASNLRKYSCGSGGDPMVIQAALEQYRNGTLQEYIFTEEFNSAAKFPNEQSLSYEQLRKLLQNPPQQPLLLMFDAKWCPYCVGAANGVSEAVNILSQEGYRLKRFSRYIIDNIVKLPYLEFWMKGKKRTYEGRFDGLSISSFIRKIADEAKAQQPTQKAKEQDQPIPAGGSNPQPEL